MIREQTALKLARDILGKDATEEEVQLAASMIVHDVKKDEQEQEEGAAA